MIPHRTSVERWRLREGWSIPEYRPPARVEAWLTLGKNAERAIVEDYEERKEYRQPQGRVPVAQRGNTVNRFIKEFGARAAQNWGLASFWQLVMEDVWGDTEDLRRQFYDGNPFLDNIIVDKRMPEGKMAVLPIKINLPEGV